VNDLERRLPSTLELAALKVAGGTAERSFFPRFQAAVVRQLELSYLTSARASRKTFRNILGDAGVLSVFLRKSTLDELYKWKLLQATFRYERRLRDKRVLVDGTSLKQHGSLLTELLRHSREIDDIATRRRPFIDVSSHLASVGREISRQVELMRPYARVTRWQSLFGDMPRNPEPQSPEDAIKLRMFSALQQKLQTTKSRSRGISDSFLSQLTALVARGALNSPPLSDALRKQRERHPDKSK
jgi:hypothetical protein